MSFARLFSWFRNESHPIFLEVNFVENMDDQDSELTFPEKVAKYRGKPIERRTTQDQLTKGFVRAMYERLALATAETKESDFYFDLNSFSAKDQLFVEEEIQRRSDECFKCWLWEGWNPSSYPNSGPGSDNSPRDSFLRCHVRRDRLSQL